MMEKLNRFLGLAPLASEHGHQVDHLIGYLHGLMFVLYGGWLLYFCYCLYRFRADRNPTASYFGTRSFVPLALILVLFALEIFDLVGVALPFWSWNADKYPKESESTVIKVAAQQFAWNVMYPGADQQFGRQDMKYVSDKDPFGRDLSDPLAKDNVVTLNEVHVVKDKPVIIYVSSKDVIHSFKVFPMRINQDAIPGAERADPLHAHGAGQLPDQLRAALRQRPRRDDRRPADRAGTAGFRRLDARQDGHHRRGLRIGGAFAGRLLPMVRR